MMQPLVRTRRVKQGDVPSIQVLFAEDAMAEPSEPQCLQGFVAVNEEDEVVGFIRVLKVVDTKKPEGNGSYVYPIIVYKSWQGYGVGRKLIAYAHQRFGELRLVACKASREFYPKCGFEPLDWDEVAPQIANDCTQCGDLLSCNPQAFVLR